MVEFLCPLYTEAYYLDCEPTERASMTLTHGLTIHLACINSKTQVYQISEIKGIVISWDNPTLVMSVSDSFHCPCIPDGARRKKKLETMSLREMGPQLKLPSVAG